MSDDNEPGGLTSELGANIDASADAEIEAQTAQAAEPKASKPKASKPKASKPRAAKGMPKTTAIILEENDEIPPTGLFVGINGRSFLIRVGEKVHVPDAVLDVLDHAVQSTPVIDPHSRQVISYRDRMRYPYRRV